MPTVRRLRVALTNLSTGPGVMTFYFDAAGGSSAAAAAAVHTFLNDIRSRVDDFGSMQIETDVANIDVATGQITSLDAVTQDVVTGADGGEHLPGATQGLLQLRSGVYVSGRELRGRLFLPAPTEGMNTAAGIPDAIYQGQMAAAGNALVTDGGSLWVIYSRTHAAITPVALTTCWNKWAVLRTRRD